MGGNALKNINNVRFSAKDYHKEVERITNFLHEDMPELGFMDIKAYREKKDFGDLDLLIAVPKFESSEMFGAHNKLHLFKEGVECALMRRGGIYGFHNNNVWSIGWRGANGDILQVDLIFIPNEDFNFAYHYFNYNDLGNFIGRTAHNLGFKYCFDGLKYVVRDGDHLVSEIVVTKNTRLALIFLGYVFENNFNTLEDIFEYVATGKYFKKDFFPLEHRSHRARVRDAKRHSYRELLKWIDNTQPKDGEDITELMALKKAFTMFDGFKLEYLLTCEDHNQKKYAKTLFNGHIVGEVTGYEGKELGKFMQHLKRMPFFHARSLIGRPAEDIAARIRTECLLWENKS